MFCSETGKIRTLVFPVMYLNEVNHFSIVLQGFYSMSSLCTCQNMCSCRVHIVSMSRSWVRLLSHNATHIHHTANLNCWIVYISSQNSTLLSSGSNLLNADLMLMQSGRIKRRFITSVFVEMQNQVQQIKCPNTMHTLYEPLSE